MKPLYIIVEGQTEQSFVQNILSPYLNANGVWTVIPICIRTSQSHRGGFVNYEHLKNDIKRVLNNPQSEVVVSMLVDYFRIPEKMIPDNALWTKETDHYNRASLMEETIGRDVADCRFVPYIQMHEFEALLFAADKGFEKYWTKDELLKVKKIMKDFPNPEDINTSPKGAPSKRLLAIKPAYQKVFEGNVLALEVGIEDMLDKCPRFAMWVNNLVEMCKN